MTQCTLDTKKRSAKEFILYHDRINYCEIIIDRKGLIQYAVPSHMMALINATGKSVDELIEEDPEAGSHGWLVDRTGYIACWSDMIMPPVNPTRFQKLAVKLLAKHGLIPGCLNVDYRNIVIPKKLMFPGYNSYAPVDSNEEQVQAILSQSSIHSRFTDEEIEDILANKIITAIKQFIGISEEY